VSDAVRRPALPWWASAAAYPYGRTRTLGAELFPGLCGFRALQGPCSMWPVPTGMTVCGCAKACSSSYAPLLATA